MGQIDMKANQKNTNKNTAKNTIKNLYKIEVTDTYGGEANYSWVTRYEVQAKSPRGAIQWLSRNHGGNWRLDYNTGNYSRYNMKGACVCCFVEFVQEVLV